MPFFSSHMNRPSYPQDGSGSLLYRLKTAGSKACLVGLLSSVITLMLPPAAQAEGEAGIISLRGQGHFFVGIETSEPADNNSVQVSGQMYVGFQLPAERRHPYPIVLVHGGGGQATNWFSTPDGRDGWRDYFLAAGFDVYWVDRPGYGRSPTNVSYGELREGANTSIITMLAKSEQWPGNYDDHMDPTILTTLASSPPGPYGGDSLAAKDLGLLLEEIGPAILMTYSAGAISGWWAADKHPDKVAAIVAIEPASTNISSSLGHNLRKGLTFIPPMAHDFQGETNAEGCELQPGEEVSKLVRLKNIPVTIVAAEFGLGDSLKCAAKSMKQAGVNVDYIYLPDIGIRGNGDFLMAEKNNGEIANALIEHMSRLKK